MADPFMNFENGDDLEWQCRKHAMGFFSTRHYRPRLGQWIEYAAKISGSHVSGYHRVSLRWIDADGGVNPIDAAVLLGTAPTVERLFWRPLPIVIIERR